LTSRPYILTEDTYAKRFLHSLLLRADLKISESIIIPVGGRNKLIRELPRRVKMLVELKEATRIIIIIDGDGRPDDVREECLRRVPCSYKRLVEVIALEQEIEEWVLKGLCLKPTSSKKPSEVLSDYLRKVRGAKRGYDKCRLPRLAGLINIEKLIKDTNFSRLLEALRDP